MVKGAGMAPSATSFCKWRRETRNSFAASLGVRMSGQEFPVMGVGVFASICSHPSMTTQTSLAVQIDESSFPSSYGLRKGAEQNK